MGPPSDVCWFINPMNTIVISTINHSEIGVMFTNLAIERGPHFVWADSNWLMSNKQWMNLIMTHVLTVSLWNDCFLGNQWKSFPNGPTLQLFLQCGAPVKDS